MPKKSHDRREVPRSMLDARHPVWTVAKIVAVALLFMVAGEHGIYEHLGGLTNLDAKDAAGPVGGALALNVLFNLFRR